MIHFVAELVAAYILPTVLVLAPFEVWVSPKSGGPAKLYSVAKTQAKADEVAKALKQVGVPAEVRPGTSGTADGTTGSSAGTITGAGITTTGTTKAAAAAPTISSLPAAVSGAVGDPTNPTVAFTVGGTGLTVTVTSSNPSVVPTANISVSGTGSDRTLKLTPVGAGYSTITVKVSDGSKTTTKTFDYAASAAAPSTTRYHLGASNASAAIGLDPTFMFVADDEGQTIRLYDRTKTAAPVAGFDFTSNLGLKGDTDKDTGLPREVDIEGGTRVGNRIFWIGSQSNSSDGKERPNRDRIFATDITGTGANTKLTYVGRYDHLKSDLVDWDKHGDHGLGKDYLGLDAAENPGVDPKTPGGYNIEGLTMAPGSTSTAYVSFRAPQIGKKKKALIVPVTNFAKLAVSGKGDGAAKFGDPILLDLGGRGIRDIVGGPDGYLIIAGPAGDAGAAPNDFRLYTWTGRPSDAAVLRAADLTGLSPEAIVQLPPGPLTASTKVQLLSDNGTTVWYGDGTAAKDLTQPALKKSRSDWVTLGAAR